MVYLFWIFDNLLLWCGSFIEVAVAVYAVKYLVKTLRKLHALI